MNVIYLVCHDLGRMLGCYGRPFATPYLDRFAREGVRFNSAFCQSPACSPSRGCAYTGKPAHVNGLMGLVNGGWSLPLDQRTFLHEFRDAGYRTVLCGLDHAYKHREDIACDQGICRQTHTENVVDAVIEYLQAHREDPRPFVMHAGTIEVHASQWQKRYPPRDEHGGDLTLRKYGWIDHANAPVDRAYMPDTPAMREEAARFAGCVAYHDFHLGRLFNAIDLLGYSQNTLVVLTTDHGVSGLRAKGTLYDTGTEITLLMRGPGLPRGAVIDDLVSNIDLAPTMLEAAGVAVPDAMHGRSFWGRATGGERPHRECLFTERNYHGGRAEPRPDGTSANYDPMRSVRTDRYHLIRNFDPNARRQWSADDVPELSSTYPMWFNQMAPPPTEPRPAVELYDVREDPLERNNLADTPELADVRAALMDKLEAWMHQTDDPLRRGPIPDRASPWPPPPPQRVQQ